MEALTLAYVGVDGVAYRELVPLAHVTVHRVEGRVASLRDGRSWHDAEWFLAMESKSAPDSGGYDKCDFRLKWADGTEYSGRFDLQRGGWPDLRGHVRAFLSWMAHPERSGLVSDSDREAADRMLRTLEMAQAPIPIQPGEPHRIVRDYRTEPLSRAEMQPKAGGAGSTSS